MLVEADPPARPRRSDRQSAGVFAELAAPDDV
jgi:hypothetical protein